MKNIYSKYTLQYTMIKKILLRNIDGFNKDPEKEGFLHKLYIFLGKKMFYNMDCIVTDEEVIGFCEENKDNSLFRIGLIPEINYKNGWYRIMIDDDGFEFVSLYDDPIQMKDELELLKYNIELFKFKIELLEKKNQLHTVEMVNCEDLELLEKTHLDNWQRENQKPRYN